MRRAKRILLPSCKSHWKSATKPNTGWSCSWSQIFLTVILQRKYTPTAARFAGFSFLPSTRQRMVRSSNTKRRHRSFTRNRTGGTLFQGGFQRVFLLRKPPFFIFSQKNIVKFLCLRKEVLRIVYIYKKEDCDCSYCLYYSKGKCKRQWCCCYQDKVRTGSPFTSNMKIIIKRRKEQHDQLKNQN